MYQAKLSARAEREKKIHDINRLKESMSIEPAIKTMLGAIFQTEERNKHSQGLKTTNELVTTEAQ